MPALLTPQERTELIAGIKSAFSDVRFIGRFLDVFVQSIRVKATSPGKALFERIIAAVEALDEQERAARVADFLRDAKNQRRIIADWEKDIRRNTLRGQTISNITAVCVEAYLQSGVHFVKGKGADDLLRVQDEGRWEIKGSRSRDFRLTINQSTVGIDDTFFVVYCGFPEENLLHGIYCVRGRDSAFSKRKPNMNMRTFLPEYYDELVERIYP